MNEATTTLTRAGDHTARNDGECGRVSGNQRPDAVDGILDLLCREGCGQQRTGCRAERCRDDG